MTHSERPTATQLSSALKAFCWPGNSAIGTRTTHRTGILAGLIYLSYPLQTHAARRSKGLKRAAQAAFIDTDDRRALIAVLTPT